jgi:hypothetical protein
MGYDVHITRADTWTDSEEAPIAGDEWKAFVDAAQDLEWAHERPWANMEVDLVVWTAVPDGSEWLALLYGNIESKNPGEPFRARMYEIAAALSARVQGDDGELYGPDGQPLPDNQQTYLIAEAAEGERERLERLERKPLLGRLFKRG